MRRRLRLPTSSDEDEELQTLMSPNPNPNPNPNPSPFEISDDDLTDASQIIISPSSPSPIPSHSFDPDRPIDEYLRNLGLGIGREWLDSCISGLASSRPGFAGLDVAGKAKLCFSQFLFSDLNFSGSGSGILPVNVHALHGVELAGPFVLQVDEIVNISSPIRGRYQDASAGFKRCLKLSMTDGAQHVVGMEYRPISVLEVLAPAGLKVCIRNVHIRRGILMLVPEVLVVLGGLVEELDAARKRLVQEVNKPPRGKRRRNGEVPSLVTRARLAAWPTNIVNDTAQANISRSHNANLSQSLGQVASLSTSGTDTVGRTREGFATSNSMPDAEANLTSSNNALDAVTLAASASDAGRRTSEGFSAPSNVPDAEAHLPSSNIILGVATLPSASSDARLKIMEEFAPTNGRTDAEGIPCTASKVESLAISSDGAGERTREGFFSSPRTMPDMEAISFVDTDLDVARLSTPSSDTGGRSGKGLLSSSSRLDIEANPSSNSDLNVDEIHKIDEVEHPLILRGDREIPFTYLASLLAKWTANMDSTPFVHGKIKCFLTGVKQFQFKQRSTYELHVYVDDGSLISEVLIDHRVVQNGIGHSPADVTAALSSSDKKIVTNMKEIMKRYQLFLANFEGTMLVEMSKRSPLPVALEMNQGCPPADALLLLRRLGVFTTQTPQHMHSTPINISP